MPPVCWAAIHGRLEVAQVLVSHGADPDLPNVDHYGSPEGTAADYARSEGYYDIAEYLDKSEQGAAPDASGAGDL